MKRHEYTRVSIRVFALRLNQWRPVNWQYVKHKPSRKKKDCSWRSWPVSNHLKTLTLLELQVNQVLPFLLVKLKWAQAILDPLSIIRLNWPFQRLRLLSIIRCGQSSLISIPINSHAFGASFGGKITVPCCCRQLFHQRVGEVIIEVHMHMHRGVSVPRAWR